MSTYSPCTNCGALNRVSVESAQKQQAVCSRCKSPLPLEGLINRVDGRGLRELIRRSPLPVIVDFWADWCAPCKMFAPIFAETAVAMAGGAVFAKLDTENDPSAAREHSIRSIPTVAYFSNGQERDRHSGAMLKQAFIDWIRSHSMESQPKG